MIDTIFQAIYDNTNLPEYRCREVAAAVLKKLEVGVPCAATGCRVRQILKRSVDDNSE